jgi:hypothetical protein
MSQQHDQDLQQEQQLLEHFREHSQGEPSAAVDALILAAARQAVEPPRPSLSQRLHAWLFGAGNRTRWSMAVAGLAVFGIGLNLALHTREQLPEPFDVPAPVVGSRALQEMAPAPVVEARKQTAEREYKKAEQAQESFAGGMDPSASYSASPPAAAPQPMAPAKPQSAPVQALADSVATPVEADAAREQARGQAAANAKAQSGAPVDNALHEELSEEQLAESLGHSSVAEAAPLELRLRGVLQLRREDRQDEAERLLAALKREYPQEDLDAALKRLQAEAAKPDSSP